MTADAIVNLVLGVFFIGSLAYLVLALAAKDDI